MDLTGGNISYRLAPFARPTATVIDNDATITGINTAEFILTTDETKSLGGEYIGQPRLVDFRGKTFIHQHSVVIEESNAPKI